MTPQICSTCVMDQTDPNITLFTDGTCTHCRHAQRFVSSANRHTITDIVQHIRSRPHIGPYDCLCGLSGGVDSSWLLHLLVQHGLRPYVLHLDTGWNTKPAVSNISNLCKSLGVQLHTHVVNWNLMRKLQVAYFYSGVLNQDMPQDIAIFSSQIDIINKTSIPFLITGANNTTESILPSAWSHHWHDIANLQGIYNWYWRSPLRGFPYINYEQLAAYRVSHKALLSYDCLPLLDLIPYDKTEALSYLQSKYNYEPYEHKHGESSWTLYYQSVYLPSVYGIDKRRAHLSNLIVNGEMTRESALQILSKPTLPRPALLKLCSLVSTKLGIPLDVALNPNRYILPVSHKCFVSGRHLIDELNSQYHNSTNKTETFRNHVDKYLTLCS